MYELKLIRSSSYGEAAAAVAAEVAAATAAVTVYRGSECTRCCSGVTGGLGCNTGGGLATSLVGPMVCLAGDQSDVNRDEPLTVRKAAMSTLGSPCKQLAVFIFRFQSSFGRLVVLDIRSARFPLNIPRQRTPEVAPFS